MQPSASSMEWDKGSGSGLLERHGPYKIGQHFPVRALEIKPATSGLLYSRPDPQARDTFASGIL